jgi:hypothetical protein
LTGWIINLVSDDPPTEQVIRSQQPCMHLENGQPVFEVWFWHQGLSRWFVMATQSDPARVQYGVVYFMPTAVDKDQNGDSPLKGLIRHLGGDA